MSRKQIYLSHDIGMPTNIMVNRTVEVVEKRQMPLMIAAFPIARAQEAVEAEKPVAILLGPQARFLLEKIKEQFVPRRIPVVAIAPETYGMMDGEKALKGALWLIRQNKK